MIPANQSIQRPVQKSTIGNASPTKIERLSEVEDWGEEINGPLSPKALSVIEEFSGVKPEVTLWVGFGKSMVPNAYEFSVPGMSNGTELSFRVWQYGAGNQGHAEVDLCAQGGKPLVSGLYCTTQKIMWIGTDYGQLVALTERGVIYRAIRQRSCKQDWRGQFWKFSKVQGFWIEMSSLRDAQSNGFASRIPDHLR